MDDANRAPATTPAETPGARRSLAVAAVTIGIGILVELALLALIPIFVTTDGAAHIDGAAALARLAFGPASPVDGYTTISWLPATNLIPELPMAALAALVGAPMAETLVIAAWIVLLPASLWYAVSGVRPGAGWLAVLALPLTFGLMLQLGFYSFVYGVLLFLVVVGYHARHREHLGGGQVAALAVLLTLTYAAHAFVFGVTVLVLAILEGWAWLVQPPRTAGGLGRRASTVLLAALPAVALVIAGVLFGNRTSSAAAGEGAGLIAFQVRALLESVTMILQLVVFDQKEAVFALLVGGLLIGLAILALRSRLRGRETRLNPADGYLAVVAVLLVAILFVPDATTLGAGGAGAFVTSRRRPSSAADPVDRRPPSLVGGGATIAVAVVAAVGRPACASPGTRRRATPRRSRRSRAASPRARPWPSLPCRGSTCRRRGPTRSGTRRDASRRSARPRPGGRRARGSRARGPVPPGPRPVPLPPEPRRAAVGQRAGHRPRGLHAGDRRRARLRPRVRAADSRSARPSPRPSGSGSRRSSPRPTDRSRWPTRASSRCTSAAGPRRPTAAPRAGQARRPVRLRRARRAPREADAALPAQQGRVAIRSTEPRRDPRPAADQLRRAR